MTDIGSPESPQPEQELAPSPAVERANRLNAANMVRSLAPLLVIVLILVGWNALRQGRTDPVHQIDPSSTVQLAAARAGYPMLVPTGLPEGFRPTSARTDAGGAKKGAPVTLQIGYVSPKEQYVGFVISDDPRADALTSVLDGAQQRGTVDLGGTTWTRSRTQRGETALSRKAGDVTVLVTGSASDAELQTVAGAVRPYSG
jgi:hypothetical protein